MQPLLRLFFYLFVTLAIATPLTSAHADTSTAFLPLVSQGAAGTIPVATTTAEATPTPTAEPVVSLTPSPTATRPATAIPVSTPTTIPMPSSTPTPSMDLGASLGITLSQALQGDSLTLRQLGLEAIYLASITANSGAVITTGTLTIVSDTQATYGMRCSTQAKSFFSRCFCACQIGRWSCIAIRFLCHR